MAVGYSDHVVASLSVLVSFCTRHLSRAGRRLVRDRRCYGGGADRRRRPAAAPPVVPVADYGAAGAFGDKGEALWRRTILMGERCQPLDFAGAIHYDSFGRRLARPPNPRSASSLSSCCSSDILGASEARYYIQNLGSDHVVVDRLVS
ncbi:hypothetical protein ABZP36_029966 [Zizania latifolia]